MMMRSGHNFAHATEAELLRVTMNLFEVAKMYIQ